MSKLIALALATLLIVASAGAEPRRVANTLEPVTEVPSIVREKLDAVFDLRRVVEGEGNLESLKVGVNGCSDISASLSCSASVYNGAITSSDCLLSSNSFVEFATFTPNGTTPLTLRLTSSSSYNFLLTVQRASDGTVMASNYGKGTVTVSYAPTTSAQLFIGIGIVESFGTGAFQLTATCGSAPPPPTGDACTAKPITPGRIIGSISSTDCDLSGWKTDKFSLFVRKGETVVTSLNSEFAGYLNVFEVRNGIEVGVYAQPDTATGRQLGATFTASSDGVVEIWVGPWVEGSTGGYTLDVAVEGPSCKRRAVRK